METEIEVYEDRLLTLFEINELTGYRTPITAYQMLRKRGIQPVSQRKNINGGGDINEYLMSDVLRALGDRIRRHQSDLARAAAEK